MGKQLKKTGRAVLVFGAIRGWIAGLGDAETAWGLYGKIGPHLVGAATTAGLAIAGLVQKIPILWVGFAAIGIMCFLEVGFLAVVVGLDRLEKRRPRITELPLRRIVSLKKFGQPGQPPMSFARFIHLLNKGASTSLTHWRATVILPGGQEYEATLIEPEGCTPEAWKKLGASIRETPHSGTMIYHSQVLTVPHQTPVEATIVAAIPQLAVDDVPTAGTTVRLSCTDGFDKEWQFVGTMVSRVPLTPHTDAPPDPRSAGGDPGT